MASHESLNSLGPGDPYMHHGAGSSLFQVMSCCLSAPSHYLHQCWLVVNGTLRNKVQWSFNPKLNIFIDEIVFGRCRRPKWRPSCLSLNVLTSDHVQLQCKPINFDIATLVTPRLTSHVHKIWILKQTACLPNKHLTHNCRANLSILI